MNRYSLTHLSDQTLLRDLAALVARDRSNTADLLAHIAEADDRKLYLPAAHPSMFSYCVHVLRLSEDAAFKRIRAARAARRFPLILAALADGCLHLTAVVHLAPHLDPANAQELLTAAMGKTKAQVERLIAERFPKPDVPARIVALSAAPVAQVVPEPVENWPPDSSVRTPVLESGVLASFHAPGAALVSGPAGAPTGISATPEAALVSESAEAPVANSPPQLVSDPVETPVVAGARAPAVARRFAVQFTVGQSAHDKLRRAQVLLSHQVSPGDLAAVFERALDELIRALEKQKFAATSRPTKPRGTSNPRHIPAQVKRAVWERDGGRCTFVSDDGHRCPATGLLEYDHVLEVARGGTASVSGIRLRCRAHNQYQAERTFGVEFMRGRTQAARATRGSTMDQPRNEPAGIEQARRLGS